MATVIPTKDMKSAGKTKKQKNESIIPTSSLNPNDLTTDDIFRLMDLHFYRQYYIFNHLYNSFNKFLDEDIKNFLEQNDHIFNEKITLATVYKQKFVFENVMVTRPTLDNGVEPMFPSDARHRGLTYSIKLVGDVTQKQEVIDIASGEMQLKQVGDKEERVPIAIIPLMLRSKYCSLTQYKGNDKNECEYDPGGYFIVNGSEKVIISQDRMVENKPLVFIKKDSGTISYVVQVNSRSYKSNGMIQAITIKLRKDGMMTIRVPILNEVNVFAVFRALGIESDRDIIDYTVYDENDNDMIDVLMTSISACKNDKGEKIQTQDQAIDYLINKLRVIKKYTETDKNTKLIQKKKHLMALLKSSLLPHIEGGLQEKAYYLGYMINKLLRVYLGRLPTDDRDSYINKRIDLPGDLLFELFKQQYKKMLSECNKFFTNRNDSDDKPINIINQIKPNTIEQGLKAALLTGSWIRRKGVAQMLQRLSYLQTLAFLRRVDAPSGDASSAKLMSPRHLHPSSVGLLCCVTGDTGIVQSNGTIKKISQMKDGDTVMSVNKDTLQIAPTPIKNWFMREANDIIKITTISGREIKCTQDHPILVTRGNGNMMVNAGSLKVKDKIVCMNMPQYEKIETENTEVYLTRDDVKNKMYEPYCDEFERMGFVGKPISNDKLEILARLTGLYTVSGRVEKRSQSDKMDVHLYVWEESDVFELIDDIIRLGFDVPNFRRIRLNNTMMQTNHVTWDVSLNSLASYLFMLLNVKFFETGLIPDWIMKGSRQTKREFLSGMQGVSTINMARDKLDYTIKFNIVKDLVTSESLQESMSVCEQIKKLYSEFNIQTTLATSKGEEKGTTVICLDLDTSYDNINKCIDNVGFRYYNRKRKSAMTMEFIKYRAKIDKEIDAKCKTISDMVNAGKNMPFIATKMNMDVSQVKKLINRNNGRSESIVNDPYIGFMDYNKFYKTCKIEGSENMIGVPIKSIEPLPNELVYDFETTLPNHTFITDNGMVVSNCIQTPEHAKVGLTKHLAIIASITIMAEASFNMLRDMLIQRVINIRDIPVLKMREMFKVFLNGEWLGVTDKPTELEKELAVMKLQGGLDPRNVSIVSDYHESEVRIYCDSGRMYRPVMRVENNEVLLKKEQIENVSLNKINSGSKITDWDEFMMKHPYVIEYIDMEAQPYLMVSHKLQNVEEMRLRMKNSLQKVKDIKNNAVDNRYNDMFYLKYTHCEFHPSLLVGEISTNVPFCDRNQAPRNIFNYAQSRQAMGIYATNYRDRLDISYILYHPQKPLVTTRTSKYIGTDILPAGENAVVAIACYSGLMVSPCRS